MLKLKISLFDIEEFININNLKEVSSPVLFERGGVPHPKGLVSNEIFGINTKSRKETFAYIDLHGYFFHPHIYKVFKRLFRNIESIIAGTGFYSIDENGALYKDNENGQTGLKFIYDNWDKIKWTRTQGIRNQRIDILTKSKKNEIFMKYQIVIPAFYRDISSDANGGGKSVEINDMYSRLIRMTSLLTSDNMFDFSFHNTILNIQNIIVEIYDYFKNKLDKKNGLLRKYLLGKNTDYSVRTVISAPCYHIETPDDNIVNFDYAAVPISQCCVLAYVHIVYWLRNFFEREFILNKFNKPVYNPKTNTVDRYIELQNPESYFTDRYIKKAVDRYIKNPESRFDRITLPVEGEPAYLRFVGRRVSDKNITDGSGIINRDMTWTDLLYMAACDVTEDKHVVVTRYPLTDYFGIFFNKIHVSSTNQTEPVEINGKIYKWYPKIDLKTNKSRVSTMLIDTLQFSNSYLKGIGGDYDGDQVTVKMLWTQEANDEADRIMNSKNYMLNANGSNVRKIDLDVVQSLYSLTKDPK